MLSVLLPRCRFNRIEIRTVIRGGRRINGRHCWLKWRINRIENVRLAFAISRKHTGTNVKRNLIKRHHRLAARQMSLDQLPCDVVVFSQPSVIHLTAQEIKQDVQLLWQHLERAVAQTVQELESKSGPQ